MAIKWGGDLGDDCTAHWSGLILRAEWMYGDSWWWAVLESDTGIEIVSSNNANYAEMKFTTGDEARAAAEQAAREFRGDRAT